jgi:hypothetical protein
VGGAIASTPISQATNTTRSLTGVLLLAAEAETLLEAEPLTLGVTGALLLDDCTAQTQKTGADAGAGEDNRLR